MAPQAESQFCLSSKKNTTFPEKRHSFQPLSSIEIYPGVRKFYTNVKVTQKQGFGWFNLAVYWKKYRGKQDKEACTRYIRRHC